MKLPKLNLINRGQKGFTLIEIAIAIAISGLIASAITMTIFQIVDSSGRASNHMTVVRQAQSAGYWISSDVRMAHVITPSDPDDDGFPLVLQWTEWDGTVNSITYTLEGNELIRNHNGAPTVVAQFIESVDVQPRPYDIGKLTFTVTSSLGDGSAEQSETRIYEIAPRPG